LCSRRFSGADAVALHDAPHRHGLSAGLHRRFDNAVHGGTCIGHLARTRRLLADHSPGNGVEMGSRWKVIGFHLKCCTARQY